jgi:rubrerythrin
MNVFKFSEVLEIAVQIEQNGEKLYRHAATLTDDGGLKSLFTSLADEEVKHKRTFEGMLAKAEEYHAPERYAGEYCNYLRAYAQGIVFSPESVDSELGSIADVEGALEFGIQREIESILYYIEAKNFVPESQRGEIDRIIDEERRHYLKLLDLKKSLK